MKTKSIEVFEVIGVDGDTKQVVEASGGLYCLTCNSQFCVHCHVVEKKLKKNEEN
jgi:hypothetical protein